VITDESRVTTDGPAPRVISADEATALAIDCLKEGRPRDARALLQRVLEVQPGHPAALHFAGMLAYHAGHRAEALQLVEQSLEAAPAEADWHSNHGILLQAGGDLAGAMRAFETAIALQPGHARAHNNLGVLLRVSGRCAEAEAEYRTAAALQPDYAEAYSNLAILLDAAQRPAEAFDAYCQALTLKPHHAGARRYLAMAYCHAGQRDKAIAMCEDWLRVCPDDAEARHTLAACSGREVPRRAADQYVQQVFDRFAATFEAKLTTLDYRAPSLIADAVAATGLAPARALDVLDVGCGTGWCGPLLAPYARHLTGVDLSAGMLDIARDKRVYDELVQAELTAYLAQHAAAFDIIVTADTLVYFGELDAVIAAAAAALRPGGVFAFTLEEMMGETHGAYRLEPHGRYSHAAAAVEAQLVGQGMQCSIARAELRKEAGMPVAGLVVRAIKRGQKRRAS
jgi:predicted TPR repeat methyltransferase